MSNLSFAPDEFLSFRCSSAEGGAFNTHLPNGSYLYSTQDAGGMAVGPLTPGKCRTSPDGHVIESTHLKKGRISVGENGQSKQPTVSNEEDAIQICCSQGPALPSTMLCGEFSLLLRSQHQKAVNRFAGLNRTVSVSFAPVTPEKINQIHDGLPVGAINFPDDGEKEENHQQINGNIEIEKERLSNYCFQDASGQTYLSPLQCFQQNPVNQEHENIEVLGINYTTPQQKTKKKKHRPKVIREDKPAKKSRKRTPESTGTKDVQKPSGKRKYVRKKKPDVCTPTTQVGKTAEHGNRSARKSAKRALNFDSEAVLNNELTPSNIGSDRSLDCQDHNDDGLMYNAVSNRASMPFSQGFEEDIESAKFFINTNSSQKEVSSKHTSLYESSNQYPAPSWRESLQRNHDRIEMSSGNKVHQLTPEAMVTLHLPFSDAAFVNKELQRECKLTSTATYQNHEDVMVSNYCSRKEDENINNVKVDHYNSDQVNHLPEMSKKRKAQRELENASKSASLTLCGRENLCFPFEEVTACGNKLVSVERPQAEEQVVVNDDYDQTEGKRTELYNASAEACSQPASASKYNDYKKVSSSSGILGEVKAISVAPSRQKKHHITNVDGINFEQAYQESRRASACGVGKNLVECNALEDGTLHRKESQKCQTNPIKCRQDQRNCKQKCDASSASSMIVPPANPIDVLVQKMRSLVIGKGGEENTNEGILQQSALVPYQVNGTMIPFEGALGPLRKRLPRAKVDLDTETNRVWMLLMGKEANNSDETLGKDKEKWWKEERCIFRGRVDSFIARMHLVQGDRRFSQWKGSVVDSVIGVFLTQNVSDHLSSSAYMALAARFPVLSSRNVRESNTVNESVPATDKVVETEGEVNLQDNMSTQLLGQNISTFRRTCNIEEKGTANGEAPERNTEDFLSGISNERNIDECGVENDLDITTLKNRIPVPLSLKQQKNFAKVDDLKLMENGLSSQNSVVSSQNSSDSPVQTVGHSRVTLETYPPTEEMFYRNSWNCLEDSTPFVKLLQLAETGIFQGVYHDRSGSLASKGSLANATNSLDYALVGQTNPALNHIFNDGYTSDIGMKCHESCNFTMSSCVPSTSHLYSSSNFGMNGMEDDDISRKGLPFFTSFRSQIDNTTCTKDSIVDPLLKERREILDQDISLLTSRSLCTVDSFWNASQCLTKTLTSSPKTEVNIDVNSVNPSYVPGEWWSDSISNINNLCTGSASSDCQTGKYQQNEREVNFQQRPKCITKATISSDSRFSEFHSKSTSYDGSLDDAKSSNVIKKDRKASVWTKGWISSNSTITDSPKVAAKDEIKPGTRKAVKERQDNFDWDSLRKEAYKNDAGKESSSTKDSVDWEAVRNADVNEISNTIRERGMNNMLAQRIKDFLDRLVREHGSIDLEWLRYVPPDKVKDYLLSIRGLGLKSVECVRLLTLHHLAFPVDTNVGRICVRLGWVPLQPLPESLQLHLLELYPMLETIQKYLWPRLCTLDQRTLYELHYQLITFGKVFCTKSKPNCNACPMRGECKHFASAFASARLALPGPEEKGLVPLACSTASKMASDPVIYPMHLPQLEPNPVSQRPVIDNSEPIIEEPATPEPECSDYLESAIEDNVFEDSDEIPTIKLNIEQFTQNLQDIFQGSNMELQDGDMSKALVALTPEVASIPQPKLKNVSRLRTEHQVYELPDSHPLLESLDKREVDDPCPYLLAIWTPGETAQSMEPPDITCTAQGMGKFCDRKTCFCCNSIREAEAQKVRGTLLIPCRTAMRGSFPLNGTYFQVNEVFADHVSSLRPIDVPRGWLWNLPRRTVYFGTSVTSIFRGLTTESIQQCFWRGFVCVRGFDQKTRAPRPLVARLHLPASKVVKNKTTPSN